MRRPIGADLDPILEAPRSPKRQRVKEDDLSGIDACEGTGEVGARLDRFPGRGPERPVTRDPYVELGIAGSGGRDVSDSIATQLAGTGQCEA